jgi:hypothetical protein
VYRRSTQRLPLSPLPPSLIGWQALRWRSPSNKALPQPSPLAG